MLNAACTGSSSKSVPGTRAPPFMMAPGTTGPRRRTHAGKFSASIMQPRLSMRQSLAVSYASLLSIARRAA
jgi:hypothetical protein